MTNFDRGRIYSYHPDMMLRRYLHDQVLRDLERKMVFVGGPRQVGKTTFALHLLGERGYLNWDIADHRERILRRELPPESPTWVFDEIHKYRGWRNLLKGLYDEWAGRRRILVTGSARLDVYRFGGDSLQGRYHYLRLHPLSLAELPSSDSDALQALLTYGGFPEPFLEQSEVEARRWSREYRTRLVHEDIASLERVQDLGRLELLMLRLPELVGSPLSIQALREDLQVAHKTVASWIAVLERLYAVFRIAPFGPPRVRAVKKAQKHYHLDWSLVPNLAARFENLVAAHLLKWVHFEQDARGRELELRYFRGVDGREVDFVVLEDRRPICLVEAKWSDAPPGRGLRSLARRYPDAEAWQISATGKKDYLAPGGVRVCPAPVLLGSLV